MAGSEPGTVVAMEILVEQNQVAPVRILLEYFSTAVHRSLTGFVPQEDVAQPALNFLRHFEQRHELPGACWTLDLEFISKESIQVEQGPDDQHVHGHPNRS